MSIKPDDLMKNPEQLKQMIGLLSSMLEQIESNDTEEDASGSKSQKQKPPINKINKSKKIKKTERTINKFDAMPESSMYRENKEIAKKLYSKPPIERRPKKDLVQARCRLCGKLEKVSPSLVIGGADRYKCNKCSSSAG
jgi:hypothetical protein